MRKVGETKKGVICNGSINYYRLGADTVRGVYNLDTEELDISDLREFNEYSDAADFYRDLAHCGDEQVLICNFVTDGWLKRINGEFGVNQHQRHWSQRSENAPEYYVE